MLSGAVITAQLIYAFGFCIDKKLVLLDVVHLTYEPPPLVMFSLKDDREEFGMLSAEPQMLAGEED